MPGADGLFIEKRQESEVDRGEKKGTGMNSVLRVEPDRCLNKTSDYLWMNVELGGGRIGKMRVSVFEDTLVVNSINIYPEFERNGYARKVMDSFKEQYEEITADRVRSSAVGFWKKMHFSDDGDGNFSWKRGAGERGPQSESTQGVVS